MTSYPVILVLYEFKFFKNFPLRLTHTEVVVHGKSFGYDDNDGLTVMDRENLHGLFNYKIKQVIPLGVTLKTENDLKRIIREINGEWTSATYRLFNHNCRHFSKRLIEELEPSDGEEGIEVLQQLIFFGESVGVVLVTIIRAVLLKCIASPYQYMSYALNGLNCALNGEIFNYPCIYKDLMLIFMSSVLVFYFARKFKSLRRERDESEIDQLVQEVEKLEM